MLSAIASGDQWLDKTEHNGILYFLFDTPRSGDLSNLARIERFNLATETWLAQIGLNDVPTAFAVDDDGLFISFGRRTSRFTLLGTNEIHLRNTSADVDAVIALEGALVLNFAGDGFLSMNKSTGVLFESIEYFYSMTGFSASRSANRIFGRSTGISPSDMMRIVVNPDGTFASQVDSPYHGDYPGASRTYIFPNEARVVDNAGIIYNSADLTFSNSLAGSFTDLAFYGDLPIVLRGVTLYAYSNTMLETGQLDVINPISEIWVANETVYGFFSDASAPGVGIEAVDIALLNPQTPGEPVDPVGLAYTPDAVFLGQDEIVYLLSIAHLSIFRWDAATEEYLDTLSLTEAPKFIAYSADPQRLYLAYATGKITKIDLDGTPTEEPFVNSPEEPLGLSTADELLFVCDPTGAWVSHFTYSPDGVLLDQREWNYFSYEYVWSPVNRKMYFQRDDMSPLDILSEDIGEFGTLGDPVDSPLHTSDGFMHPIRVSPDGSLLILGSGRVFDAISLVHLDNLSNNVTDVAWDDQIPYSLRDLSGSFHVQRWNPANYGITGVRLESGTPYRLLPVSGGFLLISIVNGIPTYRFIDASLANTNYYELTIARLTEALLLFPAHDLDLSNGLSLAEIGILRAFFDLADLDSDGELQSIELLIALAINVAWVDFDYTGIEIGTPDKPFSSLRDALDVVAPGASVNIMSGLSSETGTFDRPIVLYAHGGTVRIGGAQP